MNNWPNLDNLTSEDFQAHLESFEEICDLGIREHRVHLGDILRQAQSRGDADSIRNVALILIIS